MREGTMRDKRAPRARELGLARADAAGSCHRFAFPRWGTPLPDFQDRLLTQPGEIRPPPHGGRLRNLKARRDLSTDLPEVDRV